VNIIHIVPDLSLGGVQTFSVDLANEQVMKGHNVVIATLMDSSNDALLDRCDSRIVIVNLKCVVNFYNVLLMRKILEMVAVDKVYTVHTHGIANYFSLMASCLRRNSNFVHTVHNLSQNEAGKVRRWIAKFSYRLGLVFPVTISDEVSESFQEYYPKILFKQINNGLSSRVNSKVDEKERAKSELDRLRFNVDTKIYLSVGRVDHQKNRAMLLDAFHKFSFQRNVVLAIIGGPIDVTDPFYGPLADHPAVKEKKVYFLGLQLNVNDFLYYSDYFCLTSLFEGLPISVLEAIRAGLICICTPAGGIRSVLKNMGYISTGFGADEFVAALIESENNSKDLASDQIEYFFKTNWDMGTCAAGYLALYRTQGKDISRHD